MKNYEEHSKKITLPIPAQKLWTNISDFWQMIVDTKLVTASWAAWLKIMDAIFSTVDIRENDVTIFSDIYSISYNHIPVELILDTSSGKGYVIQGYNFRRINQLQDFINDPEIVLTESNDYTYTTNLHIGQAGYIDTTNELPETMWAFYIQEKTLEELISRFGILVDYNYIRNEEEQTKKDILALMKSQQFGSIIQHIECAICVENNFPFTLYGGTVIGIDGTKSLVISIDDSLEVIENTTALPFRYRVEDGTWRTIQVGDFISGPSQVIEAVTVDDIISNPTYYRRLPISIPESYHSFVVRFNANLPHDEIAYEIDLKESLKRIYRLKKITSRPYLAIMFDFASDASTVSTSYVDLDSMDGSVSSTSWTNLLIKMNGLSFSSYGFDLDPLHCLLTSDYNKTIFPLGIIGLTSNHGTIGHLHSFLGSSSYGGT